jgi:fatty acid desaturase
MIAVGEEIAGVDLRELTEVGSIHFLVKTLILVSVTVLLIALTLIAPSFSWVFPSILLGLMYGHAVELQHQTLHNTAFRSTKWNRRVGIVLGLPLLVSFSDYQNSHMRHHKLLGTPEDKEFFNYGYESLTTVWTFIPHVFMVRHYRDVMGYIAKSVMGKLTRPHATPRILARIRNEYVIMAIFLLAMVGITIWSQSTIFLKLWFVPLLAGIPTHALIELPEHIGCNTRIPDVLRNTRTIKASRLAVWFADGNNYHVEHHWLPGVPNHKFPELHELVKSRIEVLEESYWSFYKWFLKELAHNTLGTKK